MPYSRTPIWSKTSKASFRIGPRQTTRHFTSLTSKPHQEVQISREHTSALAGHHDSTHTAQGQGFLGIHELVFVAGGQDGQRLIPLPVGVQFACPVIERLLVRRRDRSQLVLEDEVLAGCAHHRDARHGHREDEVGAGEMGIVGSIRATEGIADDHRHTRCADVDDRIEELATRLDDAASLLLGAGKESGRVFDEDQGNVVDVAETNEACRLQRRIDVDLARCHRRVVGDETRYPAAEATEGRDHVARALGLDFEEFSVVADLLQIERDVHRRVHAGWRVEGSPEEPVLVVRVAVDRIRSWMKGRL
jgi:hypothetical protein